MNFVKPEDADILDAAQLSSQDQSEDENGTVSLAWAPEDQQCLSLSAAIEANATQLAAVQETLEDLGNSIEEQQETMAEHNVAIQDVRSTLDRLEERAGTSRSAHQSKREQIEALQQRIDAVAHVEDDIETIENRLNQVETTTASLRTRLTRQEHHSARLLAAVFNESQPCPECEDGQIEQKGGVIDPYTLVCDQCDYEEQIAMQ